MADTSTFSTVDWRDDAKIVSFADQLLRHKSEYQREQQKQAEINLAWYRGHQALRWNSRTSQFQTQPNPFHRVRLQVNVMRPLIDGFIAKMGQDRIRLAVMPATDDLADFDSAELGTKVLRAYHQQQGYDHIVDQADAAAVLTGETFLKVCWDPDAGPALDVQPEDVGLSPAQFAREFGAVGTLHVGDVRVTHVPVMNLYWGPEGTEFEEAEYVQEIYERSAAYVMQRYDLKRDELDFAHAQDARTWWPGRTMSGGLDKHERDPDSVIVRELWVKPNSALKRLEQGRNCILVGQKVVKNGPLPYQHGEIPLVRFEFLHVPSEPHGDTFVSDLIGPQHEINRTVSQFAENRELMAQPVWLARENAIVETHEWTNQAGGVRFYRGEKPSLERGESMPNAVLLMLQQLLKFMQEIVGLHDVSQGKNPPGVRSGRAIALLKEGDDERQSRVAQRRRAAWAHVGKLILHTLSQYVTDERIIRLTGDESAAETQVFSGEMLTPGRRGIAPPEFDVQVVAQGLPQSQSARLEKLDLALQHAALDPRNSARDKQYILDLLDLGGSRHQIDPTRDARRIQHKRNREILQGRYLPPAEFEQPEILVEELNRFRQKDFFRGLPPPVQALFTQYETACLELMAQRSARLELIAKSALMKIGISPVAPAAGAGPAAPPQPPQAALTKSPMTV